MKSLAATALAVFLSAATVAGETKQVRAFVALCDNKTQGIIPVGEKIGNGDDPEANLYWGCSDGLASYFRRSGKWKLTASAEDVSPAILRRLTFRHAEDDIELVADAYRGAEMLQCLQDFEEAASSGHFALVAFIGHNGLMDFALAPPETAKGSGTDVVVLCCLSEKYFRNRLGNLGCRPVLMTRQLMYPGSFLLHDAIEKWRAEGSLAEIRAAAAAAYAKNQKISIRAAAGVFSKLEDEGDK